MRSTAPFSCQVILAIAISTSSTTALADNFPFDGQWFGTFSTTIKTRQTDAQGVTHFIPLGGGASPTCSCQMSASISMAGTPPSATMTFTTPSATDPSNQNQCQQLLAYQCDGKSFTNQINSSDNNSAITLSISHSASSEFNYVYKLEVKDGLLITHKDAFLPKDAVNLTISYDIKLQRYHLSGTHF